MEKYLPYITDIIKTLVTVNGVIFGLWISIWKYLDTKNREEKRLSYENFMEITDRLAELAASKVIPILKLKLTIYQLQYLKEYSQTIIPILNHMKEDTPGFPSEASRNDYNNTIDYVINELDKKSWLDRFFALLRMTGSDRLPRRRFAPPRNDNAATVVLNDK